MDTQFIRVHNKFVRLDSIAYIDFLDSGRSMIFVRGLNQEKQNISVDVEETRRLREIMESLHAPLNTLNAERHTGLETVPDRPDWRERRSVA